jgi:DNA-binding MarR family transcriptional regulator
MNFDTISEPLEHRLAEALARLAALARQTDWKTADSAQLTPTQAEVLRFAASRSEGVRLSAAAAHIGVRNATASDTVSALERKGLVQKHPDLRDARAIAIKASESGLKLAQSWPPAFIPVVSALTEQERELLFGLLVQAIRRLQVRGDIAPQRLCVTCRYFREDVAPESDEPHFCALVGAPMGTRHLRIDCPEQEALA